MFQCVSCGRELKGEFLETWAGKPCCKRISCLYDAAGVTDEPFAYKEAKPTCLGCGAPMPL